MAVDSGGRKTYLRVNLRWQNEQTEGESAIPVRLTTAVSNWIVESSYLRDLGYSTYLHAGVMDLTAAVET
jgi:hypothetical protein